jgi:putative Mn2+ efflux pump MntP
VTAWLGHRQLNGQAPQTSGNGAFRSGLPASSHGYVSEVLALLLVAISVGLDNLGAATAIGVSGIDAALRLRVALIFGVFEAAMPIAGLLIGRSVARDLGSHTKLVAGLILCLVGAYAVLSEVLSGSTEPGSSEAPSMARLVILGATLSIDNLAIGFALGDYHVNIVIAALVIAAISVALTLVGLELGSRLGERLGERSELVGGVMLIGIGVAIATGVL